MKKQYVTPAARIFDISFEEKIAITCSAQYFYTLGYTNCTTQQVGEGTQCYIGTPGQS